MDTPTQAITRWQKNFLKVLAVAVVLLFTLTFPWGKASIVEVAVGIVAIATSIVVPVLLGRKRLVLMISWLALYVAAYLVLSSRGAYIDANLGGQDNRSIWYPAYCGAAYMSHVGRQKAELRPLGWFFLPLVLGDRWFFHKTKHFQAFRPTSATGETPIAA